MSENTSGSGFADVRYHSITIAENAAVVRLSSSGGFVKVEDTMPVGTQLHLLFKRGDPSSPERVGPRVPAQVTRVEESSSKEQDGQSGMQVAITDGTASDFLEALLSGSWQEPEGGVAGDEEDEAQAAPKPKPTPKTSEQAAEASPAVPAGPPDEGEPEARFTHPEEDAVQPPDEVASRETEGYQKAATLQGVPVMSPPDEEEEENGDDPSDADKKDKSRKRKRTRKGRKKKDT